MTAPKRRWFQFSLLTMFVLVAVAAVFAFWFKLHSERIRFEQHLKPILTTRLASARDAFDASTVAYETRTATFFDLLAAQKALAEAEMELATNPDEEIAALQKIVARLKSMESLIQRMYEAGLPGGPANVYNSVKRDREAAEIALSKAQFRAGKWLGE